MLSIIDLSFNDSNLNVKCVTSRSQNPRGGGGGPASQPQGGGGYPVNTPPLAISAQNQGQQTLKSLEITKKQIELFLFDYIEHCYPTLFMSFVSFEDYLRKYSEFRFEDKWLRRVFNGYADHSNECGSRIFLDDLLLILAFLDYDCPSYECRLEFVLHYYDLDRDGYLSEEEFREMVRYRHKSISRRD